MTFDQKLAGRIRTHLGERIRLDPAETDRALSQPYARVFDLTGRPMKGWILVESEGLATGAQLGAWVDQAVEYAGALPAK